MPKRGPVHLRCECCNATPATRTITDRDGDTVRLCDMCPTPDEIEMKAADLRRHWPWHRFPRVDNQPVPMVSMAPVPDDSFD